MISRPLIVAMARSWIGTPYMHAQSAKGVGCDCLGLVRGVWRELYGEEPETPPAYASSWRDGGTGEALLEAADRHLLSVLGDWLPGDVLIFRWRPHLPARHCAIVVDEGRVVHAYEAGGGVKEGNLHVGWRSRIAGVFAFRGID